MLLTSWLWNWSDRAAARRADSPRTRRRLRRHEPRRWMAPFVEPLEQRLALTTISLNGPGDLVIQSFGFADDQLSIHADGPNNQFVISDPGQILNTGISGAIGSGTNQVFLPFGSVPNAKQLIINTSDGNDVIRLTASNGFAFNLAPVLDGGDGFDAIELNAAVSVPADDVNVMFISEDIRLGGDITTAGGKITFQGNVFVTHDVSLVTDGTTDGDVEFFGQVDSSVGPSTYTLINTPRTYEQARMQAGSDVPGGYLVTIRTAAEQADVQAFAGTNSVWLGASDLGFEGQWLWDSGPDFGVQFWDGDGTTGSAVGGEFSNWFPGEPDNTDGTAEGDAAFLEGSDLQGRWRDGDVTVARPYIVEAPSLFALSISAGGALVKLQGQVGNFLPLRSLTLNAGQTELSGGSVRTAKAQTFNSTVSLMRPTQLVAEEVNFGGGANSVIGSSGLMLAPIKVDAPITVGAATDAGPASFDLTDTDIAALTSSLPKVAIGESSPAGGESLGFQSRSLGPVTVTSATFVSPVSISGGSISIAGLDVGTHTVKLTTLIGTITDGGSEAADVTANELLIDSAAGIGASSNSLDLAVGAVAARTVNGGGIFLANTGNLVIGPTFAPGGIVANNDTISVSSTGSITVNQMIFSAGGDVSLTAADGITINGVPVDTAGGQFFADADSNNDGSGTFTLASLADFVEWTNSFQGVLADGTGVSIATSTLAAAAAQTGTNIIRFNDGSIYSPPQPTDDYVETRFLQPGESVTFSFLKPQFGLFLHFDGMQYQGTPFDPATDNPINLYAFDQQPIKVSGESTWDVDNDSNAIRQLSGDHLADQDGTVRFDGGVNSLTLFRQADGISPGNDSIVQVQLGVFRAGVLITDGEAITIRAADVNLNGFINAGMNQVSFIPSGTSRPINLGTETAGSLSLTDAELDQITAGQLLIGDLMSGAMAVTAPITLNSNLTITSGVGITINQSITLGDDKSFIAEVFGANGTLQLATVDADLTVNGTGVISLFAETLDLANGSNVVTANRQITLRGNRMILAGSVNAGTGQVWLQTQTVLQAINFGSATDPGGGPLSLSDGELDSITAESILVGNFGVGPITISAMIDRSAATTLSLITADSIIFASGGSLDAFGGDVSLLCGSGSIVGDAGSINIKADQLFLSAGGGGVGDITTPLSFDAVNLFTSTIGDQFLREIGTVTIVANNSGLRVGSGTIHFNGGTFVLGGSNLINDEADVSIAFGATLDLGPNNESIDQLVLIDGSVTGNGTLTGGSTFDLRKGSIGVNLAEPLGISVDVSKVALDTVTLSGPNNSFTGETLISSGTLALVSTASNNSIPNSPTITVQPGAMLDVNGLDTAPTADTLILANGQTLQGSGVVSGKLIAPNGSTIAPGNSPGVLSSGSVNLQAGSALNIEINGNVPGTGYDQLNVAGSVMLNDATLNLSGTIGSVHGQQIVIVNNDQTDPIGGLFKDAGGTQLTEGAIITVSGVSFILSYAGGAGGNDVTLTQAGGTLTLLENDGRADLWSIRLVGGNVQVLNDGKIVDARPTAAGAAIAIVGENNQNDMLTLDFGAGNPIPAAGLSFSGGAAGNDTLRLMNVGTGFSTQTYNFTNANDGSVVLNNGSNFTVNYIGLEPITNDGTAIDIVFNLPTAASNASLEDDGTASNGLSRVRSFNNTFERVDFTNPTGSLTINRGNAADSVTVNGLPDFNAELRLGSAANPLDSVTFAGPVTLAANKNLSANASGTISFSSTSSDIATSGSGSIALTTARNIALASGSSLVTASGPITLIANSAAATSGDFAGIDVNGATISTGSGDLTLNGHGGDAAGNQLGVLVQGTALLNSTAGQITVTGTAGGGTGNFNVGILIAATLTAGGGDVTLTGVGGGTGAAATGHGIFLGPATVTVGGTGKLTIAGSGAAISGGDAVGVHILSSTVTTAGGDMDITGTAGGTGASSDNIGVVLANSDTTVSAGGSGKINITGFGGQGTGTLNAGVRLGRDGTLQSVDGDITITGTEGNGLSAPGFRMVDGFTVQTTGSGNLAIIANSVDIPSANVIDVGSNQVKLRPLTNGTAIDLGSIADPMGGPLALSDSELDVITAGTLLIGDADSGSISVTDNISRPAATDVALMTGGNSGIAFIGSTAILDSNNGNVTLALNTAGGGAITSGDALKDVRGINVSLTSGSEGIGADGNSLLTDASNLTATTAGDADMFLGEIDALTIGPSGLSAGLGTIHLTQGRYRLSATDQLNDASSLSLDSGAVFQLNGFDESVAVIAGSGAIVNGSTTPATLTIDDAVNGSFTGTLGGTGTDDNNFGVSKTGAGTLTLSGINTYLGSTTITAGTLTLNGSITSDVSVFGSGTLAGSGTIDETHTLTIGDGGTVAPGNSPDILNSGSVMFTAGSNFNVELNGTLAGQEYDQLNVTGTVDLGDATLNPTLGFAPAAGATFVIINNDGSDSVTGTFGSLPQGSFLSINGNAFHIVYDFDSGDGQPNDVAIIANRSPMISAQTLFVSRTAANNSIVGTIVATDPESAVTFALTGGNTGNTFSLDSDSGQLTVSDFTGLATGTSFNLTVVVTDDSNATATAQITVTITNQAPSGTDKTVTTNEDTPFTFTASDFGFSDPDDSPANNLQAVKITTLPGAGTLTNNGGTISAGQFISVADLNSGKLKFTPAADANGLNNASFTFQVQDDGGTAGGGVDLDQSPNTITIDVTAVADITNDSITTNEDSAITANVITGTSGATADTFAIGMAAITSVTQGTNGTVTFLSGGSVTYAPNADFYGNDSFTYTVTSGGVTETATVSVTVTAVADITNDSISTNEDSAVTANVITGTNGATADTFAGGSAAITAVTQGTNGSVTFLSTGSVTYTPVADFNGSDSFTYTVTSGGVTETATVSVTINAVADITNDSLTTNEDSVVTANVITGTNGATADTFVGGSAAITAVTQGTNGSVTFLSTGSVTYTPVADFNGSDSFTYTVTSGGVTETATVSVTINAVTDITNDSINTNGNSSVAANVITGTNGATADTFESGSAAITAVTQGTNGLVTFLAGGDVTYTPNAGFNGSDSFTYTVTSGGGTETATVSVVMNALPTTLTDTDQVNISFFENSVLEGALPGTRVGITLSASDPNGGAVFYRLTDDAGGRFAVDPLTGVVTVKTGYLLNVADATQYTILGHAVDANGNRSPETSLVINVLGVPADALPFASILPSRASVVEGSPDDPGNNFVSFLVKLSKPSAATVQVDFVTRVGDDPSFSLPEGIPSTLPFASDAPGPWDFFRSSGRLTFDPGVTEQIVRVQLRPDDRVELNELFFVQLTSPVNAQLAAGQSVGIAQILDDDTVPQIIVENTQVLEGDAPGQKELIFRFQLMGGLPVGQTTATVDYSTGNIAVDTASASADYSSVTGTLTFTETTRVQDLHVFVNGDVTDESDETVSVHFTNAVNLGLSREYAIGTIINDDSPNAVVSITPTLAKIPEGNAGTQTTEFLVTLVGKPTTDVSVSYTTEDREAKAGTDYVAANGVVTFTLADIQDGIVQKSIFVTVNGDTLVEPNEAFVVSLTLLGSPPNVSLEPDNSLARVVVRDDDKSVLTEDADELFAQLAAELTRIFNAGSGLKNNPVLIAEMQRQAPLIARSLGLTKAIVIILDPVDFVLTDPQNRQSGYTESTGVVNQIPGAYYSGDGAVELLIVPLPEAGTYNLQLAGVGGGDFNASITIVDGDRTTGGVVSDFSGNLFGNGQVAVQVGNVVGTIPVGLGLASGNSGIVGGFGVVGALGKPDFQLALAVAQIEAELRELDLGSTDSLGSLLSWLTASMGVMRTQLIKPLWQSLETPLGTLLSQETLIAPRSIPADLVDHFWSQVGQSLTGVPASVYRLGDMLESLLPTLAPRRNRLTTPRSGEQDQPNTSPKSGVKTKRSSLERPRSTPTPPAGGSGQVQPSDKTKAAKDKAAQSPDSKKADNQQSSAPRAANIRSL